MGFVLLFLPRGLYLLHRILPYSAVVISISNVKISPPVPAGFAKNTPGAASPRAMPDQRMEPWVSSLCATLSQKGGLEVISALLSLRAPWQRSHLDINTHQKRAGTQTGSPCPQRPGGRFPGEQGHQDIPRMQRSASLAASRSTTAPIK